MLQPQQAGDHGGLPAHLLWLAAVSQGGPDHTSLSCSVITPLHNCRPAIVDIKLAVPLEGAGLNYRINPNKSELIRINTQGLKVPDHWYHCHGRLVPWIIGTMHCYHVGLSLNKYYFLMDEAYMYGGWERTCMQTKFFFGSFSRLFIFLTFFSYFFTKFLQNFFFIVFPTFHFRFPNFLLPFSRLLLHFVKKNLFSFSRLFIFLTFFCYRDLSLLNTPASGQVILSAFKRMIILMQSNAMPYSSKKGPMGLAFLWSGCSLPTIPPVGRRSPLLRTRGYVILQGSGMAQLVVRL